MHPLAELAVETVDVVGGQQSDVSATLPQRRQRNRHYLQAVEVEPVVIRAIASAAVVASKMS